MFTRVRLTVFLVLSLLVASMFYAGGLSAQEDEPTPWFVLLLNSETKEMAKVYLDGTVETSTFPVPGGTDVAKTFSADGNLMALSVYDEARDDNFLYIHDFSSGTTYDYDINASIGAFSPDGTRFVCQINYYPGVEGADASPPEWALWVIDVSSGAVVYQINADTFDMEEYGLTYGAFPYVFDFPTPDEVIFLVAPSTGPLPAYRWVLSTNTFEPVEAYGKIEFHALGDEKVWLDVSEDWPLDETLPMSGYPTNAVMYANETDESYLIFSAPAVGSVVFINEGQQIAVSKLTYDAETYEIFTEWVVLDRDGTVSPLMWVGDGYHRPINAPGGYLEMLASESVQTVVYHQMETGDATELWRAEGSGWRVMWSPPVQAEDLEPFAPLYLTD